MRLTQGVPQLSDVAFSVCALVLDGFSIASFCFGLARRQYR
jgi:hypothetical protein